jgi:catechol 2,3-dioxygenase-like lactoylglutathione lyase family enzyme
MLGDHPIHPVLLSTDLEATRDFYHGRLGLEILAESDAALEFGCGGGTRLVVTRSSTGTNDTQTQVGWDVDDIHAELAELRSRGVRIEDYDMPGLRTTDGIADFGDVLYAWITDPGGNVLGIAQPAR